MGAAAALQSGFLCRFFGQWKLRWQVGPGRRGHGDVGPFCVELCGAGLSLLALVGGQRRRRGKVARVGTRAGGPGPRLGRPCSFRGDLDWRARMLGILLRRRVCCRARGARVRTDRGRVVHARGLAHVLTLSTTCVDWYTIDAQRPCCPVRGSRWDGNPKCRLQRWQDDKRATRTDSANLQRTESRGRTSTRRLTDPDVSSTPT